MNINSKSAVSPALATDYFTLLRAGLFVRLPASNVLYKDASGIFTAPARITAPDLGFIAIGAATASMMWRRSGAAADQKDWEFFSGSDGYFTLRALNDAYSAAQNAYEVMRGAGATVDHHRWRTAGPERMRLDSAGNLGIGTASPSERLHVAGSIRSNNLHIQGDASNGYLRPINAGSQLFLGADGANKVQINATGLYPVTDNSIDLGGGSNRWKQVFAVTGVINTSDEREKQWLGALEEAHLRAARRIEDGLGFYQWLGEVAAKGGVDARIHFGARAQRVAQILIEEGLEAAQDIDLPADAFIPPERRPSFRHALLCFDTWEATPEIPPAPAEYDEDGEMVSPGSPGEPARPAGNRFGFRADQLALFLIAAQAEMRRRMEARIDAIEAQLAA